MDVLDYQIPEGMNCADYCDAIRDERYKRRELAAKQAQAIQVPASAMHMDKSPSEERAHASA